MGIDASAELGLHDREGVGLDIRGALHALIQKVDHQGGRLDSIQRGLWDIVPRRLAATLAPAAAPATYSYIEVGGPRANGRLWDVHRLTVIFGDPFTAVAANNGLWLPYVAGSAPQPGAVELPVFTDAGQVMQSGHASLTFGKGDLTLFQGERLIIAIKTLPANVQVSVSGQADEYSISSKFWPE